VKGRTVAELGNRNRPLDMFGYEKGGEGFILMANSSRGVMKVSTKDIGTIDAITRRVAGVSGLSFETIESWKGVVQLAKIDDKHAAIIRKGDAGQSLEQVVLP
jgi:type IV secretory pathway ATPase VirB11/archaellum biosynthesis ATPase